MLSQSDPIKWRPLYLFIFDSQGKQIKYDIIPSFFYMLHAYAVKCVVLLHFAIHLKKTFFDALKFRWTKTNFNLEMWPNGLFLFCNVKIINLDQVSLEGVHLLSDRT